MLAIGGAVGLLGVCALGVWALRRDAPPAFDEAGRARLPIVMPRPDAEAYLRRIGYPHVRTAGTLLVGEDVHCSSDAECRSRKPKIVFDFGDGDDRPRCISVSHAYDLDWRSIAGKLAGISGGDLPAEPRDLRRRVSSSAGSVMLVVPRPTHVGVGPGC
jgi:hypothetical protein